MTKSLFPGVTGILICLGFISHGSAALAQQFFRNDPLLYTNNPEYYGAFMQHHPGLIAQQYYGGLHDGIDVRGAQGDEVYSPNGDGEVARVAFVGLPPAGKVFIVKGNCYEQQEAVLLGHVVPNVEVNDRLDGPDLVGWLDGHAHLHAAVYRGYDQREVWQDCPTLVWPDLDDPITNDDLKECLVNPVRYAFEEAPWIGDNCGEPCRPMATAEIHYASDPDSQCYVAVVTASDQNNSIQSPSGCRTGIYEMTLYADDDYRDSFWLDRFQNRNWTGLPTAADYYYYPDDPPDTCNQADPPYGNLHYYLIWETTDTATEHHFEIVVRDAKYPIGNPRTIYMSDSDTVGDPVVSLTCETRGTRLRLTWTIPEDWVVEEFNLYRSTDEGELGYLVNEEPIRGVDDRGESILNYEYFDEMPTGAGWERLFYTLKGAGAGGKTKELGRTAIRNPLWGSLEIGVSPNPFGESVDFGFLNPSEGEVRVSIYDVSGRLINSVLHSGLPRGWVTHRWDGRDRVGHNVSPGVYFVAVTRGSNTRVAKITLVK